MPKPKPQALTCRQGHYRWTDWQICPFTDKDHDLSHMRVGVAARCDLGDHWLAPDPNDPTRVISQQSMYLWPSHPEGLAAVERWCAQRGE